MDRSTFETHLRSAAQQAVTFARQHVLQPLPDALEFLVYPNLSYDGNPRVGDEATFPDESLAEGECHGPWTVEQVVNFLWRDGKVPEWIDVAVQSEHDDRTVLGLSCCGRFTAQEELLYHRVPDGIPPFSVKSPNVPPGWETIEASGKFDLHWRASRTNRANRSTPTRRLLAMLGIRR
jgi:hypothetical protein